MNGSLNVARLREEMLVRGLSGQELAERACVSAATVSHAVTGRAVSARTVKRLAMALTAEQPLPGAEDLVRGRAPG